MLVSFQTLLYFASHADSLLGLLFDLFQVRVNGLFFVVLLKLFNFLWVGVFRVGSLLRFQWWVQGIFFGLILWGLIWLRFFLFLLFLFFLFILILLWLIFSVHFEGIKPKEFGPELNVIDLSTKGSSIIMLIAPEFISKFFWSFVIVDNLFGLFGFDFINVGPVFG